MLEDAPAVPRTLMRQLPDWVAERPRGYGETMDAWRTNCPRLSAWEDAIEAGFLRIVDDRVQLTAAGERARRG